MNVERLVSVIMPVYKSEAYIRQAILSVVNQTYPHIELLCINDATPDASFDVCKELQKEYPNIVLLENKENRGQEYTRNRGLEEAHGEYLLFLDSDDELASDTVERLVTVAERQAADVVLFNYANVVKGEELPVSVGTMENGVYTASQFAALLLTQVGIGVISCIGNKLYRTDRIRKKALRFNRKYRFNEDGAFFLNYIADAQTVCFVNEPFYKYLIRDCDSTMSSYRPQMFSTIAKARELIKEICIKNKAWGEEQQVAYYREMLGLMLNSLINEVKFGDKASFKAAVCTVRQYEDFEGTVDCLKKRNALSLVRKIAVYLLERNQVLLLRMLVKFWYRKQR